MSGGTLADGLGDDHIDERKLIHFSSDDFIDGRFAVPFFRNATGQYPEQWRKVPVQSRSCLLWRDESWCKSVL